MPKADLSGATGRLRRIIAAAPLGLLAACAVTTPFAISSTGNGLPAQSAIALPAAESADGDRARMQQALAKAFARHSVTLSADARYLADYAISVRDAQGGLTASTDAADENSIDWEAQPRKSRLLDGCDAQRLRATLVVLDRETGSRVYRGEGEATACGFSDAELASFAGRLVDDALGSASR